MRPSRLATGLLAAGATLALAVPTLAAGSPAVEQAAAPCGGSVDSASPEVGALAKDLKLSTTEASKRIGWQQAAGELDRQLRPSGSSYGGVWIDPSTGRVKVGRTGSPELLQRAVSSCGLSDGADLVPVKYSAQQLDAAATWLGERLGKVVRPGIGGFGAGIDYSRNQVILDVPNRTWTAAETAFVKEATSRYGALLATSKMIGTAEPAACSAANYCDPPLRGGVHISSGGGCTLGFMVRSLSNNVQYAMTAGHCGGGTWTTQFSDGTAHVIGARHSGVFGASGDAEIITVNNPAGWSARAWVLVEASADTARDESYNIAGVGGSTVGMRLCKTGYSGNTACGVVTRLGVSVNYGGTVVNNLGEANFCVIPGDSGGPNYASHLAYGLTSGYVVGASPCRSFYQGAAGAAALLNVRISTEG